MAEYIPNQSNSLSRAMRDEYGRLLSGVSGMVTSSIAEPIAGLNALVHGNPELVQQTRDRLTFGNPANLIPNNLSLPEWAQTGIGYFNESADRLGEISPVAGAALKTAPAFVGAFAAPQSRAAFANVTDDIGRYAAQNAGRQLPRAVQQGGYIGGVKSKTANIQKLEIAQQLREQGVDRDTIFRETDWYKDGDGHWKYEGDDSKSLMDKAGLQEMMDYGRRKQNKIMQHDDLYNAYPDAGDISTGGIAEGGAKGTHWSDFEGNGEVIGLDPRMVRESLSRKKIAASALDDTKSVNMHEVQHGIQDREGFSSGGNPEMFADDLDALVELNKMSYADMDDFQKEMFADLKNRLGKAKTPFEAYQRLGGEAEARNVQARLNMSMDERRAKPPWMTLDVPESELIYRGQVANGLMR